MKKLIIGWVLNVLITIGVFFCICFAVGLIIGIGSGIAGNNNIPTEEEFANDALFGIFCFFSLIGSNFAGYYFTVKKYILSENDPK